MRFVLAFLVAAGCGTERYTLTDEAVRAFNHTPPEARGERAVPAVRESTGESVLVHPTALRFEPGSEGGAFHASGQRLHAATGNGLAVLVVGLALITAGAISYSYSSPRVNPSVASCESSGGWFCGFGEAVAGISLLAFGGSHVIVGGGLALGTMNRREAEVSDGTAPRAPAGAEPARAAR
jgi:hypothetical protein